MEAPLYTALHFHSEISIFTPYLIVRDPSDRKRRVEIRDFQNRNPIRDVACMEFVFGGLSIPCPSMLMACHAHKKPEAKFAHLTLGIFCEWLLSLRAGGRPPDWSSRVFGAGNAVSNVWKARHRRSCLPHQADPCGQQSAEKSDNCMVAHMLRHEARTLSCA